MATVKIILRKIINKDGKSPLAMQITKDRKKSIVHLGYHLLPNEWDAVRQRVKKSHPNSVRMNNFLAQRIAEATDKALELETNHKSVSSKTVMKKIKPHSGVYFFKHADAYLKILKEAGKYSRYTPDKSHLNHFRVFLKGSDIIFPDITQTLLNNFKHYLLTEQKISERTAINHLVVVRSVFSAAIKDGSVEAKYYPFGKGKIAIKFPETNKVGLSINEVKQLETAVLENPNHNHARNLWLISFYYGGMRISDVLRLRWSDFKDSRLNYTMGKNLKPISLKTPTKALAILAQYEYDKSNEHDYIFPELKTLSEAESKFSIQHRIADCTSRIDKFLRKNVAPTANITSKLTMHIARHTFGNIAGDKIPVPTLQKIFRHSDLKTTIGYMANFIHKNTDDALDAVLDF